MKLYHLITLGCKVNAYESEAMGEILQKHGYEYSPSLINNDLVIINTCSVTQTGDAKSRKMIRRAIANSPQAICMVVGCYSQIASETIKDIEGVNIIIGTKNRDKIYDYIEQYQKEQRQIIDVTPSRINDKYDFLQVTSYSENTRAYLKIQDGCNNFCSYCIIPYTRGALRSRDKDEIIQEAQKLVDNNFKEIVLTGIHTAGYGDDFKNYHFSDLLEEIADQVKGLKRLRISSIEASQIDDCLINLIKTDKVVVNHLHIPLQSGCDTVLKRMNRKYNCAYYYSVITRLRDLIPDIAITTDVIVGFPGESDQEFNETVEFIKKVDFCTLHVFPFSKRSGTPASKMSHQVDEKIKAQRVATLVNLSSELHANYAKRFIGKEVEVLFETYDNKTGKYYGLTPNYLKVAIDTKLNIHNQIRVCKMIKLNENNTIEGELVI